MLIAYIAVGGAIGASLRYIITSQLHHWLGDYFPYGTCAVNIVGSLCMGVAVIWLNKNMPDHHLLRSFLLVGILGGFTTFSAFSLDSITLINRGDFIQAALYIAGSVILSLTALCVGMWIAQHKIAIG